jgi:hypothetical protein
MNCACDKTPIACNLNAIDVGERAAHATRARDLFDAATAIDERAGSITLTLPDRPGLLLNMARFIDNERSCCSFWRFTLDVEPNRGNLHLRLSGPPEAQAFIKDLLAQAADSAHLHALPDAPPA